MHFLNSRKSTWLALLVLPLVAAACATNADAAAVTTSPGTEAVNAVTTAPTTATTVSAECGRPGIAEYTLEESGTSYAVRVFVPQTIDADAPAPVVLNWHGLGSEGSVQAAFTAYETLAEAEGFIVVSPTGVPAPGDDRNSWELIQLDTPGRDDVAFASSLIDDIVERFCGDANRVYSTGMSNGGLFTSRLVCDLADKIAAASSVAGLTHPDECEPSRAVPFIAFHGNEDGVVPYDGTTGSSSLLPAGAPPELVEFFSQVMPDEFAEFAADAGCNAEPVVTEISAEVKSYDYQGCADDTPMTFYEVVGGGHTWPGSSFAAILEASGLGHTTLDIDATATSWEFFQQHTLNG